VKAFWWVNQKVNEDYLDALFGRNVIMQTQQLKIIIGLVTLTVLPSLALASERQKSVPKSRQAARSVKKSPPKKAVQKKTIQKKAVQTERTPEYAQEDAHLSILGLVGHQPKIPKEVIRIADMAYVTCQDDYVSNIRKYIGTVKQAYHYVYDDGTEYEVRYFKEPPSGKEYPSVTVRVSKEKYRVISVFSPPLGNDDSSLFEEERKHQNDK
jgi:hypothetical protein